uniref:SEC7 domain-containing protein n=1 Tax=Romanomermis culicivorax TaxID=13658 RepID=A0A915I0R8_ROMCU
MARFPFKKNFSLRGRSSDEEKKMKKLPTAPEEEGFNTKQEQASFSLSNRNEDNSNRKILEDGHTWKTKSNSQCYPSSPSSTKILNEKLEPKTLSSFQENSNGVKMPKETLILTVNSPKKPRRNLATINLHNFNANTSSSSEASSSTTFFSTASSSDDSSSASVPSYEFSSDFQQKQIEILENRYGGRIRANRAASVIQRAYRRYDLQKKFKTLVSNKKRRNFREIYANEEAEAGENSDYGKIGEKLKLRPYPNLIDKNYTVVKVEINKKITELETEHRFSGSENIPERCREYCSSNEILDQNCNRTYFQYKILSNQEEILKSLESPTSKTTMIKQNFPLCRNFSSPIVDQKIKLLNKYDPSFKLNYALNCPVIRIKQQPSSSTGQELAASSGTRTKPISVAGNLACATPSPDDSGVTSLASSKSSEKVSCSSPTDPVWIPRETDEPGRCLQTSCCHDPNPTSSNNAIEVNFRETPTSSSNKKHVNFGSEGKMNSLVCAGGDDFSIKKQQCWPRRSLIRMSVRSTDVERKRQYRIALNFFNKKPERGIHLLIKWNFVESSPLNVAKFLMTRKGLSKQMIGEYLGNLQNHFSASVLDHLANEIDLRDMDIDTALRHFQSIFRLPGEAQKIERIMEVFARRYWSCNQDHVKKLFRHMDTVFILSFAIIMLNTDLHSPNIKPEKRMRVEDFIRNLRGVDGNNDIDPKYLTDLYNRIKSQELKSGADHVSQVLKVERSIEGKKLTLALNYRRLVCYCRLYEVVDPNKKQSLNAHQREIFLFNDMLMVTKLCNRKKNSTTYTFRESHCLVGVQVELFCNIYYGHGLRIVFTLDNKVLFFNARNEEDRSRFFEDLKESIFESDEMEALRIEIELEKQQQQCLNSSCCNNSTQKSAAFRSHSLGRPSVDLQQRDSGVGDMENVPLLPPPSASSSSIRCSSQNKTNQQDRQRRVSDGSLDSGMTAPDEAGAGLKIFHQAPAGESSTASLASKEFQQHAPTSSKNTS